MASFLTRLFRDVHPLDDENLGDKARDVAFRVLEDGDIAECLNFYRKNQSHLPAGKLQEFETQLINRSFLTLIATCNGKPMGCCGLAYNHTRTIAMLCYGLVDPAYQHRGIGTAQVLVRLAPLTTVDDSVIATMFALPRTLLFYKRFGFDFSREIFWEGHDLRVGVMPLSQSFIDDCRRVLAARNITYPDIRDRIPQQPDTGEHIRL